MIFLAVLIAAGLGVVMFLKMPKPARTTQAVKPIEKPSVRVLLQINLGTEAAVYPGMPLIAEAGSVPVLPDIKPVFEVTDVQQKKQNWSWEPAEQRPMWLISAEAAQKIKAGSYQVRAVVKHQGKDFHSNPVTVEIKNDAPAENVKGHAQFLAAFYLGLKGETDKALAVIDSFAQAGRSSLAFEMKGGLLESLGRSEDALKAYEQALSAYQGEFPPAALVRKKQALWRKVSEEFRKANPNPKPAS